MNGNTLKQQTKNGILWSTIENFSTQAIVFLLGLVMARLLSPAEYGVVGMLTVFISIAQTFVNSGFSNALIRKKDRNEIDFSTAFYFNVVVGVFCYLLLFALAPFIADFYNIPILSHLTKLMACNVLLNSLAVVQRAKFTILVDFKTQAKATLIAVITSGVLGIYLAYTGWGVWSIAIQSVVRNAINVLLLWVFSKWIPSKIFSWDSFREMFNYGYKLLLSSLIDSIYSNIYTLVIGKLFSAKDLGSYTRANQFAALPSSNVTNVLGRVTFPILSQIQDDDDRLASVYRKYLRLAAFIVFPMMLLLAVLAKPLIITVLTDRWSDTIILLQIICFSMMWYPIHAINLNLIQVKGRSDWFLKLEIIKKIIGISILFITIPMGIIPMVIGSVASSIICLAVNTHYTAKLINLGLWKQLRDLCPTLCLSISMCVFVFFITYYIPFNLLKLIFGGVVGIVYFYLMARLFKMEELKDIISLVRRK